MAGGYLQLVAKNYDDLYLTITPQITLFKCVYRRYTHFSIFDDEILIKTGGNFSSKTTVTLDRKADLLHKMYVTVDLPQIKIAKHSPTYSYISSVLTECGVAWNYASLGKSTDIVPMTSYDTSSGINSIVSTINNRVEFISSNYNFINNGIMMANDGSNKTNLGAIAQIITNPLTRLQDTSGSLLNKTNYTTLETSLVTGRNSAMALLYKTFSSYVPDYGTGQVPILSAQLLSSTSNDQTLTYPTTKTLSMYNPALKNQLLTTGMLLGALSAYSRDSLIYNGTYKYYNSGSVTKGTILNASSSSIGIFLKNIVTNVTAMDAVILGSTITGGFISGSFVDRFMTFTGPLDISGLTLVNVTITDIYENVYTNYTITNCSLEGAHSNDSIVTGTIVSGTIVSNTISNFTIRNAVFSPQIVSNAIITDGIISNALTNDGSICLPSVVIKDINNLTTTKTLINCTILDSFGNNIPLNTNTSLVGNTISIGTVVYIVLDKCSIANAVFNGNMLKSGKISGGALLSNNITVPSNVNNIILTNTSVKIKNSSLTLTDITIINCNLTELSIINDKITNGNIVGGITYTNVIQKVSVDSAIYGTQTFTSGIFTDGNLLNYPITGFDIANGIISTAFLTNATLIDVDEIVYKNNNFNNIDLLYSTGITNATVINNNTNLITIPDVAINSFDNIPSKPLFGNIIERRSIKTNTNGNTTLYLNNKPVSIPLHLYNSDDFRYITYITYLNNITRVKIISSGTPDQFNPTYSTYQQNQSIQISAQNLDILTPQLLSLDESILFYHVVDPVTTKYNVYGYNIGQSTFAYFNNYIQNTYNILTKYNSVIPVYRNLYTQTDAYMIYNQFMQNIISLDPVNNLVSSQQQIQIIANLILANIDTNIKYNFLQLYQILTILYNGYRYMDTSYITTFYRTYSLSTTTQYVATSGSSFTPITGNTADISDNFLSVLNNITPIQITPGSSIVNFFNTYINSQFNIFITSCQNQLRSGEFDEYMNNYSLWSQILFQSNNSLTNAYSLANQYSTMTTGLSFPLPNSSVYGKMAVSSYIPFAAARDIPRMIYDTLVSYSTYIFRTITNSTVTPEQFNAFIITYKNAMDYRDLADISDTSGNQMTDTDGIPYRTKQQIYIQIIKNVFVATNYMANATSSTTTQFLNESYFETLQQQKASGNNYLLAFTFKPDSFMVPSSKQNTVTGDLIDLNIQGTTFNPSTDMTDMSFLPIEWLTQTYYNILGNISDTIIDSYSSYWINSNPTNSTLDPTVNAKQQLRGILANIVNCFIATSKVPSISNYINNNYSMLNLVDETSSVIQQYTKTIVTNIEIVSYPLYSDAISSIWYQSQKKFIQLYNELFNDTILSKNYYKNNLGISMKSLYDYVNTKFTLASSTNVYYSPTTTPNYPNKTPGTITVASSFTSYQTNDNNYLIAPTTLPLKEWPNELYPAVDTANNSIGFDMYRIANLIGNPPSIKGTGTTFSTIGTFANDFVSLYTFALSYYNLHKPILQIKNDSTNLTIYGFDGSGNPDYSNTSILQKSNFMFDQSQIINNYIYNNVFIKYINPVADISLKTSLQTLALNTMNYWTPAFDGNGNLINSGLMGPLDLLYGTLNTNGNPLVRDSSGNINYTTGDIMFPAGNIPTTLNKLAYIPSESTSSNYINLSSYTNNPFSSFFMHDWYLSLESSGNFITYQTLQSSVVLFNEITGSTTNKLITSNTLANNPYMASLYTSTNGSVYGDASIIANMLFDGLVQSVIKTLNTFQFGEIASQITSVNANTGYNQTVTAIRNILTTILPINVSAFNKITTYVNPALFQTMYGGFNQYINIVNTYPTTHADTDISYYRSSTNKIKVPLETRLLNSITNAPPKFAWVNELGNKLIKKIDVKIGGQLFDSHSSELLHFINKIYKNSNQNRGYDIMIGNIPDLTDVKSCQRLLNKLYIPLHFWFTNNAGNSLPLLCLLYSEVQLVIEMNDINSVLYIEDDSFFIKEPKIKTKLLAQYIFLDEDERTRMANSKLEYLIESFNYSGTNYYSSKNMITKNECYLVSTNQDYTSTDIKNTNTLNSKITYNIYLNDPIKYLIWYIKIVDKLTEQTIDKINWNKFGYSIKDSSGKLNDVYPILSSIVLKMNGSNRENPKNEYYYTYLLPYSRMIGGLSEGEYFYSFALYPTLLQPSGAANYSELTDSSIELTFTDQMMELLKSNPNLEIKCELWGCAYKNLRVMSGFGALAFYK